MSSSVSLVLMVLMVLCAAAEAQLRVFNLRATNLPSDLLGISDGYVKVFCGSTILGETAVRENSIDPWWDEEFTQFRVQENDLLRLEVHDSDLLFDDLLGVCDRQVKNGTHHHDCFLQEGGVLHYSYSLDENYQ